MSEENRRAEEHARKERAIARLERLLKERQVETSDIEAMIAAAEREYPPKQG